MSQNPPDGFDPNDPLGAWRSIRDANLDAWAKGMASFVNTEGFARSLGMQLDSMLAASAPVQKAMQEYMERHLAQVNMPSRGEVVSPGLSRAGVRVAAALGMSDLEVPYWLGQTFVAARARAAGAP